MTNNEKKSNEKWSLKKTILLIVLVVLLFASLFSCGLNVFKTTYNKVNQVNYDETTEILTDYTSFNKIDRDIKKTNASSSYAFIDNTLTYNSIKIDTTGYSQSGLINQVKNAPVGVDIVDQSYFEIPIFLLDSNQTNGFIIGINKTKDTQTNIWTLTVELQIIVGGLPHQDSGIFIECTSSTFEFETYNIVTSVNTLNSTYSFTYGITNLMSSNSFYEYNLTYLPFVTGAYIENSGVSYTPNPQYNIVQPSISGDLVLGTLFEPMLESQTTFGELYVSYIIGQSNSVYSLNMLINLVLEGVNNYINVPISTTLNINDLSNNSYTQVIANFDSELEELNLIIEVLSNNSVIYTYTNSFPCVMNNSFTYPYQVSGFSNTKTAKQYVISYNTNQGYNNGLNIGRQEGYSNGYQVGYDDGYDVGYNYTDDNGNYRGYEQGYHDGSNNEFAKDGVKDLVNIIFNAPYNIFNGFLNFEIFGVNLFNLLSFIFTLVLVGWIIALLMKR